MRLVHLVEERIGPLFAGASPGELALVAALAGVGEEVLFRGVLQEALALRLPTWAAIVGAGLLFGAAHWVSHTYAALAAVVGCYLGAVYHLTGTLAAPILTHASYDLVALLMLARMKPASDPSVV
jgi:membrane protease YdiL (CAAX protease family)